MKKITALLYIVLSISFLGLVMKVEARKSERLITSTEVMVKSLSLSPMPTGMVATETAEVIEVVPTLASVVNIKEEPKANELDYKSEKWNGLNTLKVAIGWAVTRGISTNTLVLLLLLPLVATLVSSLHYVVGLSGYGIFMPTMVAVTFLATGIPGGLVLFGVVLLLSLLSKSILRRLKLHFWPARSIGLIIISIGTFIFMVWSSAFSGIDISQVSIFPILFMILLAEEFTRTQLLKSKKEAKKLMLGTIVLAVAGATIMNWVWMQNLVLEYPDLILVLILIDKLAVGNYSGIRWSEIASFKKGIREQK